MNVVALVNVFVVEFEIVEEVAGEIVAGSTEEIIEETVPVVVVVVREFVVEVVAVFVED
jgi:hypothetical protein